MKTNTPIPVTVLTGFLGAGKTTLLNRLLTEQHGRRIAVIENEFGEIGIDQALVVNADEEIFEMNNGCICCTVRGDLIRILGNLVRRRDRFDYVLVETTGLADPGPVAQTFFVDEDVRGSYRLDGIITVVDAKHVAQHLDDSAECQEQIAFADKILLNKTDLVSDGVLDALERRIRSMNAVAKILRTHNAAVPASEVVDIHAFELGTKLELDPKFLEPELPFEASVEYVLSPGPHRLILHPGPDPMIHLTLMPLPDATDTAWKAAKHSALQRFGQNPVTIRPGGAIRPDQHLYALELAAGGPSSFEILCAAPGRFALHTEHGPEEFRMTLERQGQALVPTRQEAHAAGHSHDESVSSVGITETRPLDARRLNDWMGGLLRDKGADIFRMKGVLHIKGSPNRVVFQGVHMLFDAKPDRPWQEREPRLSQLVFIGRNLVRDELADGFRSCLA
ncbi:MAG: GTP-binding protein [Verrucomicrobiales bacterium]|nr:GTP-binding protein [Verrucomicrobiales bacterium]